MKKQYYTPRLKEFKTGFRYEHYIPSKKFWAKETFCLNENHINIINYVDIQTENTLLKVRVRHLDHDDIIEAGWKESHEDNFKYFKSYRIKGFVLNIINNTNNIVITEDSWLDMYPKLFEGKIKNFNQLLDVMEMLGINKEK
jgi:hypothetical protein